MKKLLIPAFACAAMFTACGDDSSSANDSSSIADASSSSVVAESSSSDWAHEPIGEYLCISSDTTSILWYIFEGPDSAMEVSKYEYPREYEEAEKICEELQAEKPEEQKVNCDSAIATINPPKTMNFDSFKALMEKECYGGWAINAVELRDPDEAPENFSSGLKNRLQWLRFSDSTLLKNCKNKNPSACSEYCRRDSHLLLCRDDYKFCMQDPNLPECANAFFFHTY